MIGSHPLHRREFLAGLASVGAAALSPALRAQAPAAGARRIDVHHHFASPGWIKAMKAANVLPAQWNDWTPARAIEAMDRSGTATSIGSITTPGIWFGEGYGDRGGPATNSDEARTAARVLSRETNEFGAKLVADHKGRYGLWVALPMMSTDDSLKELEYGLDTLKADGIGLLTSYGNRWLGHPMFLPIFQELNRRKAVVYVHPTTAPCCRGLLPGIAGATLEYNTDTSRTIVNWITSGNAAKFPDVSLIFSHAGGTIPYLIERFIGPDEGGGPAGIADLLSHPPQANSKLFHLRRFYYDTAQSSNPVQMQALKQVMTSRQIVFGTDYPYTTMVDHIQGLGKSGFTPEEMRALDRDNLVRILPKYRTT